MPGAFAYAMSDYQPQSQYLIDSGTSTYFVLIGFEVALLGLIGFLFGTLCVADNTTVKGRGAEISTSRCAATHLPSLNYKVVLSALLFFLVVVSPVIAFLPSLASIGIVVVMVSVVIVSLACYEAWLNGDRKKFFFWLLGSFIGFPLVTLTVMGFVSYGVLKSISVLMFVITFYRPRWAILLGGFLIVYFGLSFYVGYMRERTTIRDSVWGGQSLINRFKHMSPMITDFNLFNPSNNEHLEYLDMRLNQNFLVGSCVDFMRNGGEDFSGSSNFWVAATAWIPRILWPNKPVTAGSFGMVSRYTGLKFSESTSVGMGHIMELYTYYGRWSVLVGMFLLGWVVRWFDVRAWKCLQRGDILGFGGFFLICAAMLDVGSNIPTMVASMAASLVFWRIIVVILRLYGVELTMKRNSNQPVATPDGLLHHKASRSGL